MWHIAHKLCSDTPGVTLYVYIEYVCQLHLSWWAFLSVNCIVGPKSIII